MEELYSR